MISTHLSSYLEQLSHPLATPSLQEVTAALMRIDAEVKSCQQCSALCGTRTNTVFGVGNPKSKLCFLGEAPGADEDRLGEPFVGRAGQLLDKILAACGLRREEVYILNILKCRPPDNRRPLPEEVRNCMPYLRAQLAVIKPRYICCLGATAAQSLLATDSPIGRLRGRILQFDGIPVLCTFHPAYLLRNPAQKQAVWQDMKLLLQVMKESRQPDSRQQENHTH